MDHYALWLHLKRHHYVPPERADGVPWDEQMVGLDNRGLELFHLRLHAGVERPLPEHWHSVYYEPQRLPSDATHGLRHLARSSVGQLVPSGQDYLSRVELPRYLLGTQY